MVFAALALSSHHYGCDRLVNFAADYVESGLTDYGSAIAEVWIIVFYRGSRESESSRFPDFQNRLSKLPVARFYRKRAKFDLQYETKVTDAAILEQYRIPPTELFSLSLKEMAEKLHLIDSRLKKSDAFDLAGFHADVARLVASAPRSDHDLKLLHTQLENRRKETLAAMGPWERLGVEWGEYHPTARALLNDPYFWSESDYNAPHGNDSGADFLNSFKKWNKRHPTVHAHEMARRLLKDWGISAIDCRASDAATVESMVRSDSVSLNITDEVMIAAAFAAVKLRGCCDRETNELALLAIERERHVILSSPGKNADERIARLDQLAKTLTGISEKPQ